MKLPLTLNYDFCSDTGSTCSITDADGRLIVEEPGPEATWRDLEEIVRRVNAHDDLLEALVEFTHDYDYLRALKQARETIERARG